MKHQQLLERLRYLRNWELINVLLVPAMLLFVWQQFELHELLLGGSILLAFNSFLLLQGGIYWHLKLRALEQRRRTLPTTFLPFFFTLKQINRLFLLLLLLGIVFYLKPDGSARWWIGGLYLFALLEYINYFEYQLMHDTRADFHYLWQNRKLRRAPLATDLQQMQKLVDIDSPNTP